MIRSHKEAGYLPSQKKVQQSKISRPSRSDEAHEWYEKTYGKKGEEIIKQNFKAVDDTLADLFEVKNHGERQRHRT